MKLLYGTSNPGKLNHMREMVEGLGIEIMGLKDINIYVDSIDESGNNPLENAKIKALAYYRAIKSPVFSCDSGLYIEGLKDKEQPGVQVRRVKGRELTDEEMIEYYSNLALKLGGEVKASYRNAIYLILDEENVFQYDGDDIAESFIITSKPHHKRIKGFPLDSLSLNMNTRKYFMDINDTSYVENDNGIKIGFRNFFLRTIIR